MRGDLPFFSGKFHRAGLRNSQASRAWRCRYVSHITKDLREYPKVINGRICWVKQKTSKSIEPEEV